MIARAKIAVAIALNGSMLDAIEQQLIQRQAALVWI